jgi:hypothetical protein
VQEFEHEPVEDQVGRGDAERWLERAELRGRLVGRVDLEPELEAEDVLVEALRALEVRHDDAGVVVDGHGWNRNEVWRST